MTAYAVYRGLAGHEAGADSDEMAKDPVLHLDLEDTEPQETYADRGFEGGPAPALANPDSEAWRAWLSETDDWQRLLLSAVTAVDDEGVRWSRVFCSGDHISLYGRKGVAIDDELVDASVEVTLSEIGSSTDCSPWSAPR